MPRTRYARTRDGYNIAYQLFGSGRFDILLSAALWWHLEFQWTEPHLAEQLERMGRLGRVILFDKRGTGLSDRVPPDRLPPLEERADDIAAVLDAVGSERAVIWGQSHGAPLALLFAAMHPERVERLIIDNGLARLARADDYPYGIPPEAADSTLRAMEERWDEPQALARIAPSFLDDATAREWWTRMQRLSVSPAAAVTLWRMALETDVRDLLPSIRVPTLVMHRVGDRLFGGVEAGRYIADRIPDATFVEVDGADHVFVDGADISEAVEEFLTGHVSIPEPDRVLGAVVFTDIVDSTAHVVAMGDRRWRETLRRHHDVVDRALERFRGRRVADTGDGVLAVFDGPARAVTCAVAIRDGVSALGLEIRAGVHVGEIELNGNDIAGVAVHVGARIAALAGAGDVLVSRTVSDLVAGSGLAFAPAGRHALKGVPGQWDLYRVVATSGL